MTPELIRPLQGRMVAGVAAGLARRLQVPEWVPRLLFVVTAFIGGLGVALYLAGWVLMRSEDEAEPIAGRFFSSTTTTGAWIGVGLVVLAAVILLDRLTFISGGVLLATALLVVGALLYLGYLPWSGGARSARAQSAAPTDGENTGASDPESASATATAMPLEGSTGSAPPTPPPTPTPPILPPVEPRERSILGRLTVGFALLGLGMLALLDRIPEVPIDAGFRHFVALAMTIIGLGLLVGAVWGRARWLILIAALLMPPLLLSAGGELGWEGERFAFDYSPTTFEALEPEYTADVGDMVIDLTGLPWDGEEIEIVAVLDAGNLVILIPDDVAVTGEAHVDVGRVQAFDEESGGISRPALTLDEPGDLGLVDVDASVDVGNIEIVRER
ncbi:MAG: PspC domain-containing protein [Actinobacteria bacterium]|nr:PspC domain-containing protein [Actinomycetota bacterium]